MGTTAKQITRDQAGREVLWFDVPEKTGIVSVIGADTDLGSCMVKHLSEAGKTVYGFTQEKDFRFSLKPISKHEATGFDYPPHPILSDWLVLCIDPRMGFEKYTSRISHLSNYLFRKKSAVISSSFLQPRFASQVKVASRKSPWSRLAQKLSFALLLQKIS